MNAAGAAAGADPVAAAAAAAANAEAAARAAMDRQRAVFAQAAQQAFAAGSAIAAQGIPGPPPMSAMQAGQPSGFAMPAPPSAPAGASTGAPAAPINPALLMAQQVAARLSAGAGAAGGQLMHNAAPAAPVTLPGPPVNHMLAAALANIPGVQVAGAPVGMEDSKQRCTLHLSHLHVRMPSLEAQAC
jgi:hypothetical protein